MVILHQKAAHAVIMFHNGTDALYANAMPLFVGYGDAIFKKNLLFAGIFHLQKQMVIFMIKLYINDACFRGCSDGLAGVERVFQRIGQKNAQIAV